MNPKYNEIAALIIDIKPTFLRLKSQATEFLANSTFDSRITGHAFSSADEAYYECRGTGVTLNEESGGYVFADGSAIWFVDKNATATTMSMPKISDKYSITDLFHYHPDNNILSKADSTFWFSSGSVNTTIIRSTGTFTYSR